MLKYFTRKVSVPIWSVLLTLAVVLILGWNSTLPVGWAPVDRLITDFHSWSNNSFSNHSFSAHSFSNPPTAPEEITSDLALLSVLEKASGIYEKSAPDYGKEDLSNVVLMASCNFGYLEMLLNWICYVQAHHLKFFIWAMDEELHEFLIARNIYSFFDKSHYNVSSSSSKYGGFSFHRLTVEKLVKAVEVMKVGYDVWFSDVDIVFLADPWPFFVRDCDYEYQQNLQFPIERGSPTSEANSGYYLMKSNHRSIKMYEEAIKLCETNLKLKEEGQEFRINKLCDDQGNLWDTIKEWYAMGKAEWYGLETSGMRSSSAPKDVDDDQVFTYRAMSKLTHAAGSAIFRLDRLSKYLELLKYTNVTVVAIVHANWMNGPQKIPALKKFGMWARNDEISVNNTEVACNKVEPVDWDHIRELCDTDETFCKALMLLSLTI